MAQISAAMQSIQDSVRGELDEVRQLFDSHFDPRNADPTLGKALRRLNDLFNALRDDSIQRAISD
jgi:hypothetical protein